MRISDWSSNVCSSDLMSKLSLAVSTLIDTPTRGPTCDETEQGRRAWLRPAADSAPRPEARPGDKKVARQAGEMPVGRSEERRVGEECVGTCRSRGSPYH